MEEHEEALLLAGKILDRPHADPDDDLAILARQLLRTREQLNAIWHAYGCAHNDCASCTADYFIIEGLRKKLGPPTSYQSPSLKIDTSYGD